MNAVLVNLALVKPFVLALTLVVAGVGSAHSELTSSTPADGETLQAAPSDVTLNYSEALETRFSIFKVYPLDAPKTDKPGESAENARLRTNGLAGQLASNVLETQDDEKVRADTGLQTDERTAETVTLPLKPDLSAGTYVVMWRVLSVDSHTTQGFTTFQVAR